MPTYSYSTITAAQALAFTDADTLTVNQGSGNVSTVLYLPGTGGAPDQIGLSVNGSPSVAFSAGLAGKTVSYADGSVLYVGTNANDGPVSGAGGNDGLYGGQGADTLNGGAGADLLQGNQGADVLNGGPGADVIYGGQGNDAILTGASAAGGERNFAQGNIGDDRVQGSAVDHDTLLGGQGNDILNAATLGPAGEAGAFTAPTGFTGGGDDFLNGNLGNDAIFAGAGNDSLFGEDGNDYLADLGGGTNLLSGGAGNDFIVTTSGANTIDAGAGNDFVVLGNGTDVVSLGDGDDRIGPIDGTRASDRATIDGGAGNDEISATDGADSILGGSGDDTIDGFAGADTVAGGAGVDRFEFYSGEAGVVLDGLDQIIDWTAEDRLAFFHAFDSSDDLGLGAGTTSNYAEGTAADYASALAFANGQVAGGAVNYVAVQVGADVFVFADTLENDGSADSAVRLIGRSLADISEANFS